MLSGFFDTNIGPKVEKDSYSKIAAKIESPPEQILFLTDTVTGKLGTTGAYVGFVIDIFMLMSLNYFKCMSLLNISLSDL